MCDIHFSAANFKGPAERFVNLLAVLGGVLAGLASAIVGFMRWEGQVNILFKLFGCGLFGFGAFIIFWWIVSASIASLFAAPQSKEARNAVRIARFWPGEEIVRLDFEQELIADLMNKEI